MTFKDDGQSPDAVAGDGIYSALIDYNQSGDYSITVWFDNNSGKAKLVSTAFMQSVGPYGPVPISDPILAGENFSLSKSIQVSVSGVLTDDCGDTPGTAKTINPDNVSVAGKIDFLGDKDVYQLTTLKNGLTYVRLTNLAPGILPRMRVLAKDGTNVLFNANQPMSGVGYILIPLLWIPGETKVYLEVSNESISNRTGTYDISAGLKLPGEFSPYVYLPIIIR